MGAPRTLGATSGTHGTPIPVVLAAADYIGLIVPAVSFSIKNGIATIVLNVSGLTPASFPVNGYNGPNQAIQGDWSGSGGPANGQQVTLWGFTTATYFNGKRVSVISNNPSANSFSFYFNHADVNSTNDAGNTAPSPFQHYRVIRIECSQSLGTDKVYIGDGNVSTTRYVAALSLTGQLSIEFAGDNTVPETIFMDCDTNGDSVQVSVIY